MSASSIRHNCVKELTRNSACRKALIIGLHSQDGYHLCRLLLSKGYTVWGTVKDVSSHRETRILTDSITLMELDLFDTESIKSVLLKTGRTLTPNEQLEIYCLAAVSQVAKGVTDPVQSANANALGPIRLLKNVVDLGLTERVRCFFAASSEIFGRDPVNSPQNEDTPCLPTSPYGMAKAFMMRQVQFYREYYGIFACSGILYNHESEVRPPSFVTRKVTLTASAISKGLMGCLEIGDLAAERDWGHADDFVNGMWLMLQSDTAEEYLFCTGKLHTVRELVEIAFSTVDIQLRWQGTGIDEVGIDDATNEVRVRVNPMFYTPEEGKYRELTKVKPNAKIVGDYTKASKNLGWHQTYDFEDTIKSMALSDLSLHDEEILQKLNLINDERSNGSDTCLSRDISTSHIQSPLNRFEPGRRLKEVLSQESDYVYIIAEIGINHDGCLQTALRLIDAAKDAGVDAVKFQKRHLPSIYNESTIDDPNSQEWNIEYLVETLKVTELSETDFDTIQAHCNRLQLDLIITPFDEISADFVHSRSVVAFKNASCNMLNFKLIDRMVAKRLPVLISTGMWTDEEIKMAVTYLNAKDVQYSLLLSNSTYPCPYEDISLSYLKKLSEYVPVVGYSGHERGTFIPVAAVAMGARIIEKHITFDKSKSGLDHKASMEPDEWREMVRQIRVLETSMGKYKTANQAELLARQSFCLSPYAKRDFKQGDVLTENDFIWRAPGKGLYQHEISEYMGKPAVLEIKSGDCLSKSHFHTNTLGIAEWSIPNYSKMWGVKCRFHDFLDYSVLSAPVVEFHCSQKDIYDSTTGICSATSQLVVHAPEIVDMMLVDICSQDERQKTLSLNILQDTITKTIELSRQFPGKPKLVVHFGGMKLDPARDEETVRKDLLRRAVSSFEALKYDPDEIEILPENLPPKPWYLGGEWNQYGFMTADDMIQFCEHFDLKMTFDICHAQLYCKSCDEDLVDYTRRVRPFVSHLHISDATGIGGEGVQIHEGEIDFEGVFTELKDCRCSWVTEVWAGHTDNGQGVYKSMLELQKYQHLL